MQQAYVAVDVAQAALVGLERAVDAARANYAQAEARFKAGLGTSLELADAEAVRTDAEIQLAVGQLRRAARPRASLARLIGGGAMSTRPEHDVPARRSRRARSDIVAARGRRRRRWACCWSSAPARTSTRSRSPARPRASPSIAARAGAVPAARAATSARSSRGSRPSVGPQLVSAYVDTVLVRPGDVVKRGEVSRRSTAATPRRRRKAVAMQARALEASRRRSRTRRRASPSCKDGGFVSPNEIEQKAAESASKQAQLLETAGAACSARRWR